MTFLRRVINALEKIAPLSLAETSWDNVGLLVEPPYPHSSPSRVFLTIDLTPAVLEEVFSDPKVGMIVAYHPPIFRAWKQLTLAAVKQAMVMKCVARGISIYSPHTALDSSFGGVNDWLSKALGQGSSVPIIPARNYPVGQENAGSGRIFTFDEPIPLSVVIERVKNYLQLQHVRVATAARHSINSKELISTVGICAGSGSSVLSPIRPDLYFTGEMSHHEVLDALAHETSVILCEHSNTERGYLSTVLKPRLEKILLADEEIDRIDVIVSKVDTEPLKVV
ncbi:hypothetical protein G9A89_023167 [Geosiphon pyriformis]|nr:hypothetical protein G9A89_023167 [Geosiphon pyriformis]